MGALNIANRTLAVMDNYPFLRSLNNECVDLIAIDPPFAANETFTSNPRPPISQAEYDEEVALAHSHGAPCTTKASEKLASRTSGLGMTTSTPPGKCASRTTIPQVHSVIEAVEACATENEAAYICYHGCPPDRVPPHPETHRQHLRPLRRPGQQLPADASQRLCSGRIISKTW